MALPFGYCPCRPAGSSLKRFLEADRAFVQHQLETLPDSPWGTARLMWEQRAEQIRQELEVLD